MIKAEFNRVLTRKNPNYELSLFSRLTQRSILRAEEPLFMRIAGVIEKLLQINPFECIISQDAIAALT